MSAKLHFISAGAGSGKTHRLTEILHQKLSAGEIRPSGVIATTFTRSAANELRERVRSHLLKKGAYRIANSMGQASINTVNGVCGELLARFAFEAGISTEQQVLDEPQEHSLMAKAVESVMDGDDMSNIMAMARRMGVEDWRKNLLEIARQVRSNDIAPELLLDFARRNAEDMLQHFPRPAGEDLSALLLGEIAQGLPEIERVAAEKKKENTNKYLMLVKEVRRKLQYGDFAWADWAKLASAAPEKALAPVAECISAVAGRYAEHPDLHQDVRNYLAALFVLCGKALRAYADKKAEMGVLDFTDQEHLLLKALDHKVVAETLAEELDLLMVDEFQDTSPIQLALFLRLARYAREVYWVGDVKQAIYGFRGSDTALMKAILDELEVLGGDKEVLNKSWRSRRPLVDLVNEAFVPAFEGTLKSGEIRLAAQRNEPLSGPAYANWELKSRNIDGRNAALAVGVNRLVESGYEVFDKPKNGIRAARYGDIAILSKSNDGVEKIAAALRAHGIPVAMSQPGLMETPEAVLAVACLRRLNDPSDTIASAEILSLAGCEEPESWVADRLNVMARAPDERPGGYGDDWREAGSNAFPLLAELAELRQEMPLLSPQEAMQAVVSHGHLSAIIMRWSANEDEARTRLSNLDALLRMAREYEESSRNTSQSASVSGLLLSLQELAESGQDLLAMPSIDAVKVMTHHRSKGLEWPVVILTGLEGDVRDRLWSITTVSTSTVDVQDPLKDRFVRFWPWPFGLLKNSSINEPLAATDVYKTFRADALEESKRLLYVSMTRARDLLIVARPEKIDPECWIGVVGADWLLGERESESLSLPNGESVPYQHWILEPPEDNQRTGPAMTGIHWFDESAVIARTAATAGATRLPLKCFPSSASQQDVDVKERATVGERMTLKREVDRDVLGTAIHGCIGASLTDPTNPMNAEEIGRVLAAMGIEGAVSPDELAGQIAKFQAWYRSRWPDAIPYAEVPVGMNMPNGQILHGQIDLLLKVHDGWILIDHKSNSGGPDRWDSLASEYAGQLDAYRSAVENASGQRVLESWLFLPVAAGAVRVH